MIIVSQGLFLEKFPLWFLIGDTNCDTNCDTNFVWRYCVIVRKGHFIGELTVISVKITVILVYVLKWPILVIIPSEFSDRTKYYTNKTEKYRTTSHRAVRWSLSDTISLTFLK